MGHCGMTCGSSKPRSDCLREKAREKLQELAYSLKEVADHFHLKVIRETYKFEH